MPAIGTPSTAATEAIVSATEANVANATPSGVDAGASGAQPSAKFNELFGAPPQMHSLYADKNGGGGHGTKALKKTDPLVGAELPGQKGVVIQRSLGDPKGYETRNHALAWARAAGSDTAMVVLGKDKRWHAVETNRVGHDAGGGAGKVATAIQVGKIDPARYDSLKAEAMKNNDLAKWKTFAAYALGLPESEINIVRKGETPSRTQVNINLSPNFDAEGKTSGFDPNNPPWVQLGPAAFDRPANAAATLAHEEVHADHHRLTHELFAKYTDQQQKHPSRDSFRMWVAKTQDVRTSDIVAGYQDGKANAAIELEAHVEAAKVAFSSGDLAQARTDLRKVATLPNMPLRQTQDYSVDALKALRDSLGTDARKVFDAVVREAKSSPVLKGL